MSITQTMFHVKSQLSQCREMSGSLATALLPVMSEILSEISGFVMSASQHQQYQMLCDVSSELETFPDDESSLDQSSSSLISCSSSSSSLSPGSTSKPLEGENVNVGDLFVSSLVKTIDKICPHNVFSRRQSKRSKKKRKLLLIHKELRTIWQYSSDIIVPVSRHRTTATVPVVNWSNVNQRFLANVPTPKMFPKHGCSEDPSFYQSYEGIQEDKFNGTSNVVSCPPKHQQEYPFGSAWGIETSAGVLDVEGVQVHGHTWCPDKEKWLPFARFQPVEDSSKDSRTRKGQRRVGGQRG